MGRRLSVILLMCAGLAACDAGPKAAASKSSSAAGAAPASSSQPEVIVLPDGRRAIVQPANEGYAPERAARAEPVRLVAGKPLWTSNRTMSAEENARSHFERDGADFDAKTLDDYVAKAHAFTAKPPKGALTLKRPNGDLLIYEERTNTFAVMARSGAPRTMFKPRKGRDYWDEQVRKEREKSRDN